MAFAPTLGTCVHQIKAALPGMTLCQDRPRQPLLIISLRPGLQLMFLHVLNAEETFLLPPAMSVGPAVRWHFARQDTCFTALGVISSSFCRWRNRSTKVTCAGSVL